MDIEKTQDHVSKRIKLVRGTIPFVVVLFVVTILAIYMVVGTYVLSAYHPTIKNIDINIMSVKILANRDTNKVSLQGKAVIEASFNQPTKIDATPKIANYILSKKVNKNLVTAIFNSTYLFTNSDQPVELNFEPRGETWLPDEDLKLLCNMLNSQGIWIQLSGNFKMGLKLAHYLVIPRGEWHVYFNCDILLRGVSHTEIAYKRCVY